MSVATIENLRQTQQAIAGHADIATTRKYDRRIRVDANDDIDVLGRALTLEDA